MRTEDRNMVISSFSQMSQLTKTGQLTWEIQNESNGRIFSAIKSDGDMIFRMSIDENEVTPNGGHRYRTFWQEEKRLNPIISDVIPKDLCENLLKTIKLSIENQIKRADLVR